MKRKTHAGARRLAAILGLILLVVAGAAAVQVHAQVYKWKDGKGVTHYGDTPPPNGQAQLLRVGGPASSTPAPALPYELARAAQNHPVVLYTTPRCDACDQGRALLRERGIPFQERTVNTRDDETLLRQLNGKSELPLLMVGSRKLAGFEASAWQEALSAASYPRRSMLPPGYQQAAPQPANPPANPPVPVRAQIKVPPDEAAAQAEQQQPHQPSPQSQQTRQKQRPAGTAPPDFQF